MVPGAEANGLVAPSMTRPVLRTRKDTFSALEFKRTCPGRIVADAHPRGEGKEKKNSLDGVLALPDHGDDGSRVHVLDETREELLVAEVSVVLLEVLVARGAQLHGNKLEAAVLEARDDGANETTLRTASANNSQLTM